MDPTILTQMSNMMSPEYLQEVSSADQGKASFWADPLVPVHLRTMLVKGQEDIFMGNLNLTQTE